MTKNQKKIKKYFLKWSYLLGLRWWDLKLCWSDDHADFIKGEETVLARTFSDWRYMTASVTVYVPALKDRTKSELEELVVHELCHVLINEMREGDITHEERVATTLQKAFMWAHNLKDER